MLVTGVVAGYLSKCRLDDEQVVNFVGDVALAASDEEEADSGGRCHPVAQARTPTYDGLPCPHRPHDQRTRTRLEFSDTGTWLLRGEVAEVRLSDFEREALRVLEEHGPLTPSAYAHLTGRKRDNVKNQLSRMVSKKLITLQDGGYVSLCPALPPQAASRAGSEGGTSILGRVPLVPPYPLRRLPERVKWAGHVLEVCPASLKLSSNDE